MINSAKWLYPVVILIFSIVSLAASLILYIYWYIAVSEGLKTLVKKFGLDLHQFLEPQTWVVVLVLSILVGVILICISIIFIYNQKNLALFRMQHNFINNFTHELKTPVTSLKLYLETLLKHELSRDDQQKYINYMIQDVGRLSDNISQILNLAKIEGKSYSAEFQARDLEKIVKDFLINNNHLFMNCSINIHNPSGRTFVYQVNVSLFEMLLMNLLTNAVKYNSSDSPTVNIMFKVSPGNLLIQFKDNGIGLEKTKLKKIFKKFYQAGDPNIRTAKGSGIGLYMADQIVKLHKGKLRAESEGIGKGAVFSLVLPYRENGIQPTD